MRNKNIEKILPILIKDYVKYYELKPNGDLVLIDVKGRKFIYPEGVYKPFLDQAIAEEEAKAKRRKRSAKDVWGDL